MMMSFNDQSLSNITSEEEEETVADTATESSESDVETSYDYPSEDSPLADESLFESSQEDTTEETSEEAEQPSEEAAESTTDEPSSFSIDGKDYSQEDIKKALEYQANMSEFNRANTQRAQELSDQKKELDNLKSQLEQYQTAATRSEQQAQLSDEEKQTAKWLEQQGYATKDSIQQLVQEALAPIQEQLNKSANAFSAQQVEGEIKSLMNDRNLTEDQAWDVAEHALSNNLQTLPLDDVYLLMNKDKIMSDMSAAAKEQAAVDQQKKAEAGRVLSTRGSSRSSSSDSLKYNPETDRNKSLSELAQDVMDSLTN